jgi:ribosomal protein S18 acetylase RimI-like enzyme
MNYNVRFANLSDESKIFELYKTVSKIAGGIARTEDEITSTYIKTNLEKSLKNGLSLVIDHPEDASKIIAEIHCYQLEPKVFHHILAELTVVVHPNFQGKGSGKLLFTALLNHVKTQRQDILRIELITRESNAKAIELYKHLGFKIEGRLEKRIHSGNNTFEADIPMAWFNPNFKN